MTPARFPFLPHWSGRLGPAWARLAPRERLALWLAFAVVGLALLWGLGVAPALATLRQAPEQHRQLDAQLDTLRRMATTAQQLRQQGQGQPLSADATREALQRATTNALGETAQLTVQGAQATVTLRATPPEALARWLEQVRLNARLVPVQADLQASTDSALWTGQVVLSGPGLGTGN